jgi:hypothetical protein
MAVGHSSYTSPQVYSSLSHLEKERGLHPDEKIIADRRNWVLFGLRMIAPSHCIGWRCFNPKRFNAPAVRALWADAPRSIGGRSGGAAAAAR